MEEFLHSLPLDELEPLAGSRGRKAQPEKEQVMAKKEAETGYLVSLTYNEMRALQDVTDRLAQHARCCGVHGRPGVPVSQRQDHGGMEKGAVMAKKHDRHDLHVVPATVPEDLFNRQPTVEELFTQTIYDAVAGWLDAHTAELIVAVADAVADRPPPAEGG
jgi:hypothetical protein